MKASEADKYKKVPVLADLEVGEGHSHGFAAASEGAGHDHGGGHGHSMESVRTATHCGREIVIKTCYEITVDGKSLNAHLSVDDKGNLHTHALPEYSFSSAVDVVKKIVEAFPDEFPCDDEGGGKPSGHQGHDHGGGTSSSGQQGHGHGGHTH
ncbi:MAG TPA: hypothetical protein VF782_03975 [Allosphingosinicella sp.]